MTLVMGSEAVGGIHQQAPWRFVVSLCFSDLLFPFSSHTLSVQSANYLKEGLALCMQDPSWNEYSGIPQGLQVSTLQQ